MFRRKHSLVLCLAFVVGCGTTYPPVSMDVAKTVKSGTPLAEIESILGPSHAPTSTQLKQLEGVMSKMPPQVRANAERDRAVAWGDDNAFLVVKVNDEGIAWVTAWRS